MLNQQLSESPLSPPNPGETEGGRGRKGESERNCARALHSHTHTHTQWEDLSNLKCEILRQGTAEDKMFYVWTSVSWGPEKEGEGKCFLSALIPLFFLLPGLLFHPFLKLEQGRQGLDGMSRRRSLMANHHRLEQWWPKTALGANTALSSKGREGMGFLSANEDRLF